MIDLYRKTAFSGTTIEIGVPQPLFTRPISNYEYGANGQWFLVNPPPDETSVSLALPITVVRNWFEELKARVPIS